MRFIAALFLAFFLLPEVAFAGTLAEGEIAYFSGDYPTALKILLPLANQGDAKAQYEVGDMLENDLGARNDDAAAVKWFQKAADQGNADAQLHLGALYAKGMAGLKQNYGKGAKWFRKAAEQGNALAQLNMGQMYNYGWGVKKDLVKAYMWYSISVAAGDQDAVSKPDSIASEMTPEQIAEGKRLAAEWKPVAASPKP